VHFFCLICLFGRLARAMATYAIFNFCKSNTIVRMSLGVAFSNGHSSKLSMTHEAITRLRNWHNKLLREVGRATMCQTCVHRITSVSLQKRTGVFSLEHYPASQTLLWAGHVARMPKSRSPKRLMLSWVMGPRIAGGLEMTYGRSLER